ncbi:sulfite exporter TauE/SafE family protein, partial [Methylibium sp. T29-B]|uniref:sulfite exporter TauE/SafE family protein n=1 Tax=Methylibium sp. T29-B TaxID=1437443 RepID=UPI0038F73649
QPPRAAREPWRAVPSSNSRPAPATRPRRQAAAAAGAIRTSCQTSKRLDPRFFIPLADKQLIYLLFAFAHAVPTVRHCGIFAAAQQAYMDFIAVLIGFGVGAIVGMTGVGGGSLMTPLMLGVFGLPPAVAIGTDLWFAGLTKISGSIAHWRQQHIDHDILKQLLMGSIPAALATIA